MSSGIVSTTERELDRNGERELTTLMVGDQRGQRAPVEELVRRISPRLLRYFAMSGSSGQDAEDLLQECWIRIHKARRTYRPSEPLLPWIFAIARYTRIDGYRKRRRRESRETLVATVPELAVQSENRSAIGDGEASRLLNQLPKSQQEVILLLKFADMSLEEVALATASAVGTIKQRAHRAYANLRKILEKEGR
jgi:RNA polymerase sigma-70 factor (ECF subfamily)